MGMALGEYWRGVIRGSDIYDVVFFARNTNLKLFCAFELVWCRKSRGAARWGQFRVSVRMLYESCRGIYEMLLSGVGLD